MSTGPAERIAALQRLDTPALRLAWERIFGAPPPERLRRDLLLRVLAHRLQEQAAGGLSKAARRRLAALADTGGQAMRMPNPPVSRLRPGTRLIREWRGTVHQVAVTETGFEYRGRHYASLSEIARTITGTRWSGPLFFGLRPSARRPAAPADGPPVVRP